MPKSARHALRLLGSLKLAVAVLLFLAVVLALATFAKGQDCARWYVYDQPWFVAVVGLLALNILAAAVVRFPWKKSQIPFVVTHAGLLVLLAGAVQTRCGGIDGVLALEEKETGDKIRLRDYSLFRAEWMGQQQPGDRLPAAFRFQPGPLDWSSDESLLFKELSGVRLKVLRFLAHARMDEDWIADPAGEGPPAVKFAFTGPEETAAGESWLVAGQFGGQAAAGSVKLEFQKTGVNSLVEDFLHAPTDRDPAGLLSMHYDGHVQRVAVSKNVGKTISLPGSKVSVELAAYLPNARPNTDGRFVSQGSEPLNPLLELRVHLPGKKEPIRQIAFARMPFLNLEGIHGQSCPVKFWYCHPAVAPEPGIEFLVAPDGKLYCRVVSDGKCQPRGEVKEGDRIDTWAKSFVSIVKFFPHARQHASFSPLAVAAGESEGPEAAAQVEITAGNTTEQLWLPRGGEEQTPQVIRTKAGNLALSFTYDTLPLGFALRLVKFTRGVNPGGMGDASFASTVQVLEGANEVRDEAEISMNQPLVHGKFTFYQSGTLPGDDDTVRGTVLTVAHDPGRFAKYLGCLMICLGSCAMFFRRADFFGRRPSSPSQESI